eukprot:823454-Pleurochrysis_carterae.AAC.3
MAERTRSTRVAQQRDRETVIEVDRARKDVGQRPGRPDERGECRNDCCVLHGRSGDQSRAT